MITTEELKKIARLSRIHLEESEIEATKDIFAKIVAHMDALSTLNLDGVEPLTVLDESTGVVRKDEVIESGFRAKAFINAPLVEQNHFAVPRVMG
jgi:aspartyl-tRNA(Asn)/glutamyl-tRNA(Gln) amidotransferase subunit C